MDNSTGNENTKPNLNVMRSISRAEISPIKMTNNPPEEIVNAGYKVINSTNDHIYEFVGIGWIKCEKATREDYQNIPLLIG